MSRPRLTSYLNDHLAAASAGVELARRTRDQNDGTQWEGPLSALAGELESDRDTLRAAMRELELREDPVKKAGAWAGEKLGRLKFNGQLRGYNPASRMIELDGLTVIATMNRAAWQALAAVGRSSGALGAYDFDALAARADDQLARLDDLRATAAPVAFGSEGA